MGRFIDLIGVSLFGFDSGCERFHPLMVWPRFPRRLDGGFVRRIDGPLLYHFSHEFNKRIMVDGLSVLKAL